MPDLPLLLNVNWENTSNTGNPAAAFAAAEREEEWIVKQTSKSRHEIYILFPFGN